MAICLQPFPSPEVSGIAGLLYSTATGVRPQLVSEVPGSDCSRGEAVNLRSASLRCPSPSPGVAVTPGQGVCRGGPMPRAPHLASACPPVPCPKPGCWGGAGVWMESWTGSSWRPWAPSFGSCSRVSQGGDPHLLRMRIFPEMRPRGQVTGNGALEAQSQAECWCHGGLWVLTGPPWWDPQVTS